MHPEISTHPRFYIRILLRKSSEENEFLLLAEGIKPVKYNLTY
jgi:hypothetical protein